MWMANFDTPTGALTAWLGIRRWAPEASCELLRQHDRYAVAVQGNSPGLEELRTAFGGEPIDTKAAWTRPDLFDTLSSAEIREAPVESVPHDLIYGISDDAVLPDLVNKLIDYRNDGLFLASLAGQSVPFRWALLVLGLKSWSPIQDYLASTNIGITLFSRITESIGANLRGGLYIELGCESSLGRYTHELWNQYADSTGGFLVLRSRKGPIVKITAADAHFTPIGDGLHISLDPPATVEAFSGEQTNTVVTVAMSIEPIPYYDAVPLEIQLRHVNDQIVSLELKARALMRNLKDKREPEVLMIIPEDAVSSLQETLRRTPDEILQDFRYFGSTLGNRELHCILPRADARRRLFPAVSGAVQLHRLEEWNDRGVRIYVPPGYRFVPYLHLSQADRLRRALSAGRVASDDALLFVFSEGPDGRIREYILPESAFVSLPSAIEYLNDAVIDSALAAFTVDGSAEEMFMKRVEAAQSQLLVMEGTISDIIDDYSNTAVERLNALLADFQRQSEAISELSERRDNTKRTLAAGNTAIDNFLDAQFKTWESAEAEFIKLQGAIHEARAAHSRKKGTP